MSKVIIFGNSGSGKSTFAKTLSQESGIKHLDLDLLAWKETSPPERLSISDSFVQINHFLSRNSSWVIEGGYSDLLEVILKDADEVIFLNPTVETCIENCLNRPWEPHKYRSKEAQDKNLDMLLDWVREYPVRDDTFSLSAHQKLFNSFTGNKREYRSNKSLL